MRTIDPRASAPPPTQPAGSFPIYACALATLAIAAPAAAATWHVAPTGDDAASGTASSPFRTIQRAADQVAAGDTVVIHAGTYAGFRVTARGTETAPIRFVGEGAARVVGSAPGDRDAVILAGAAWVTVEGLAVTGATRAGIAALDCHHITVRRNRVDANGRWGVFSSFCDDFVVEDNELSRSVSEHGVYASNSADRPVIRRNLIWGNGMCGVHLNGDIHFGGDGVISGAIVEANVIVDNGARGGSGINGDGVTGAVIRNNVLDRNHASGISLYRIDGGAPSTGNLIANNTVRMASDARGAINIQDRSTGNTIVNNILLNPSPGRGAIELCGTCIAGTLSDHNAVVGRFRVDGQVLDLAGFRARTGTDAKSFVASDGQLFVDPKTGDLRLAEGSVALDRGQLQGAPPTAIDGVPRPQGAGIDVGAYERCAETPGNTAGGGSIGSCGDRPTVDVGEPGDTIAPSGRDDRAGELPDPIDEGGCNVTPASGPWLALVVVVLGRRRRQPRIPQT
jgi:uncharacterized protein (TIGR03382 family)